MTKSKLNSVRLLFTLVFLLGSFSLHAQTQLRNQISVCAAITNVIQRLACFDELASSLSLPEVAAFTPVAPATTTAEPAQPALPSGPANPLVVQRETAPARVPETNQAAQPSAADAFGKQQTTAAVVETSAEGDEELVDTVASVSQIDSAKIRITLTSGQVWGQTVGKRFLVREGDTVRIRNSSWGKDFRLYVDGKKSFIQVARIR